jgi:hypothetical protein
MTNTTETYRLVTAMVTILQIQLLDEFVIVDLRGYYGETSLQECGRSLSKISQSLTDLVMVGILGKTPAEAIQNSLSTWNLYSTAS